MCEVLFGTIAVMDKEIGKRLKTMVAELGLETNPTVVWASPTQESVCDLTTTYALAIWKHVQTSGAGGKFGWQGPMELADYLVEKLQEDELVRKMVEEIRVAAPGYINIKLRNDVWAELVNSEGENFDLTLGKKVMIEFGHPNTHKEMHIGHLRTLITGESLARLGEKCGSTVMRANYQGDIGPHVAKALYGVRKLLQERNLSLELMNSEPLKEKAKFLGEAYVLGNQDYDQKKKEIDAINQQLYSHEGEIYELYLQTRQWSLDYFEEIYKRLGTRYDKYYFETQVAEEGKKIVEQNVGTVFENDQGTIVFRGEKFGLHTRVFVTKQGTPTYEAKEMALAVKQYNDFAFDLNLHVVANEQSDYFKVVFKALEQLNAEIAKKERHMAMGMVNLVGMKISSRTGIVVTVNQLLDQIEASVRALLAKGKTEIEDTTVEALCFGAVKFALLKQSTTMNIAFDIDQSVALIGFTGPYLQYTHARCRSILNKAEGLNEPEIKIEKLEPEEKSLMFWIAQYSRAIEKSWEQLSPHHLCEYLQELAARYNLLYNNLAILEADESKKGLRLRLSQQTGKRLKEGLELLGIETPEKL